MALASIGETVWRKKTCGEAAWGKSSLTDDRHACLTASSVAARQWRGDDGRLKVKVGGKATKARSRDAVFPRFRTIGLGVFALAQAG